MKPLVLVLVLLLSAGAARSQGHDHGPGDGHDHAAPASASPAPSPSPVLPPPSAQERVALEKLAKIKQKEPKSEAEELTLRTQYAEALGDFVVQFPESPRAPFALEAALKLLVGSGEASRGEKLAALFLEKAQKPETKAMGRRQMLQVLKFGGQPEKAVAYAIEQAKANATAADAEWYIYEAASIEVEQAHHDKGVKLLEDFLTAHPKHPSQNKFTLRIADFLISGGRPKDALAKLEAFNKEQHTPDDQALGAYFTGVANLSASRQATGDEAAAFRKAATAALEPLMAAARKDPKSNRPYGGMAFSSAADVALSAADVDGAVKIYKDMAEVFKGTPEGGFAERAQVDAIFIGAAFDEVAGPDINGKPIKSSDFKGKIVLIDFFSASFGGYPGVLAAEKKIQKRLAGKKFAILGVNLDNKELAEPVKKFVASVGIDWPVMFDGSGFQGKVARSHNVVAMPANYVLDENGTVLRVDVVGPHLEDILTQEVERLEKGLPSTYKPGKPAPKFEPSPAPAPSPFPNASAAPSAAPGAAPSAAPSPAPSPK